MTGMTRTSKVRKLRTLPRFARPAFLASLARIEYCGLVRCEEAVEEGVLCQLRRCVKIELHHELRFVKFDCLR